ncbi:MAG TPA: hypothetical protein VNP92_21600 [Actinophytocola sp.]|nr:hypothetical protein [Actinophytocola sp.]
MTQAHQERVAAAAEVDAEARRVTDLYTKAVDQLGSDKAPVRLGGWPCIRNGRCALPPNA